MHEFDLPLNEKELNVLVEIATMRARGEFVDLSQYDKRTQERVGYYMRSLSEVVCFLGGVFMDFAYEFTEKGYNTRKLLVDMLHDENTKTELLDDGHILGSDAVVVTALTLFIEGGDWVQSLCEGFLENVLTLEPV